ncbi:NKG2-A/NKG2-B type II integral membrane protein-like [Echinops telfairi]|uniref:NKG2-A/NKG2-B type II integral membrane protein-like n=2 Tax=Echinops telfairi TaxID=9371 RepID=A0AC55DBU2_ECHTE|nr:NKG2-A/NKG2-B type II integral membrane protein-like [Echinops telfairi]XP_045149211.1 NKG2-A/NKG2-B type II integral membrane protein-like [Echinops telfairi]
MNNQTILYSELNLTKSSKRQQKKPKDANSSMPIAEQEITYVELNLQNTCQDLPKNKKNVHFKEKLTAGILGIICIVLMAGVIALITNTPSVGTPEKNNTQKAHNYDSCRQDWICHSNNYYYISTEKKNWAESKIACASKKSILLITENDEEMNFINSLSSLSWIGLNRNSTRHDWFWINGSVFRTNKRVFKKTNHNCGMLYSNALQTDDCENSKAYVCKHKL